MRKWPACNRWTYSIVELSSHAHLPSLCISLVWLSDDPKHSYLLSALSKAVLEIFTFTAFAEFGYLWHIQQLARQMRTSRGYLWAASPSTPRDLHTALNLLDCCSRSTWSTTKASDSVDYFTHAIEVSCPNVRLCAGNRSLRLC